MLQAAVIALWLVLNITFNFYNKWVLSPNGAAFVFPAAYTMCHMVASVGGARAIMAAMPELNTLSWAQFWGFRYSLVLLSVFFSATLVTNNASLSYLGLSVNQVIKSASPLPQLIFGYAIEGKTTSRESFATIIATVVFGGLSIPLGTPSVTALGVILALASVIFVAAKVSLSALLMKDAKSNGLNPTCLVFYDCAGSFWFCLAAWVCHPSELTGTIAYFAAEPLKATAICVGGSLLAVAYNLTNFTLTKVTNSMTCALLSSGSKIGVIAFSAGFIERTYPLLNWLALLGFFAAICYYVWINLRGQILGTPAAPPKQALAIEDAKSGDKVVDGVKGATPEKASETTPLTGNSPVKA
jgi:drug/metabolite transporter (DMT)-like permease